MSEIGAIGFDLDGTLFDHTCASKAAVVSFVAAMGGEIHSDSHSVWSAAEAEQFEQWRPFPGVTHLLDAICISEEIGVQKPAVEAFETLTRRLNVSPDECLFVGDNPSHDIAGAQRAGLHTLLIDHEAAEAPSLTHAVRGALGMPSGI